MGTMMIYCYLYSTSGCHLCDDAWQVLTDIAAFTPLHVEEVDIAESDALIEQYGTRIPVLIKRSSGAELDWPFTQHDAIRFVMD